MPIHVTCNYLVSTAVVSRVGNYIAYLVYLPSWELKSEKKNSLLCFSISLTNSWKKSSTVAVHKAFRLFSSLADLPPLGSKDGIVHILDILFSSNHNVHKSSHGLCFRASDPLIDRF